MIDPKHLNASDKGRRVVYNDGYTKTVGIITSWNERYIFVDYSNQGRGQATRPEDLSWDC